MTEQEPKSQTLAPLRNVTRLLTLMRRLQSRADGIPGLGVFYGWSGLGKSMAASYCANNMGAIHVEVRSVWSHKDLCIAILEEFGIRPQGSAANMVRLIAEALASEEVPLIIDEADFLVRKQMIEIVRDIHGMSDVPVILIGEELLPQKLQQWERVNGRVRSRVSAEPADDEDFDLLRRLRCPEIAIEDALVARIKQASSGSARRIVVNLEQVREVAALTGSDTVTLADFVDRHFETGDLPPPRNGGR